MPRAPRLLSAFLLVAALSTPAVSAKATHAKATPRPRAAVPATARLSELWVALTHLWGEVGSTAGTKPPLPTADNGCSIDPYGSCSH